MNVVGERLMKSSEQRGEGYSRGESLLSSALVKVQ